MTCFKMNDVKVNIICKFRIKKQPIFYLIFFTVDIVVVTVDYIYYTCNNKMNLKYINMTVS